MQLFVLVFIDELYPWKIIFDIFLVVGKSKEAITFYVF